ncbi:MAG: alanine racemase [Armatimonadota bacterium]|nr:alanine racemase [Armatimonadota bacterium]
MKPSVFDLWVEVDLAALRHNFAQLRNFLNSSVRIMAVVKSNAYGHGYVRTAQAFVESGAEALAVTRIEEALILRESGISVPILLFAPLQKENIETALEMDLHLTVCSERDADYISCGAVRLGKTASIHVKVDTGMGRLGVVPDDVPRLFAKLTSLPGIEVVGVYTHFATATDRSLVDAQKQLEVFQNTLDALRRAGFKWGLAHAANSASILRLPASHLDMVRPGTLLYGQYPSKFVPRILDLKPTWRLKARVCQVRELGAGIKVGYGGEFVTKRRTKTAVIPVGYADGFTLVPEGPMLRRSVLWFLARKSRPTASVWIRGRQARVIGRVGMQLCVVDVTDIPGVEVGDEVVVPSLRIPTNNLIPRVYFDSSD